MEIQPCSNQAAELDADRLEIVQTFLGAGYAVLLTPIAGEVIVARVDLLKLAAAAAGGRHV